MACFTVVFNKQQWSVMILPKKPKVCDMKRIMTVGAVVMGIFAGNVLAAKKTPNQRVADNINTIVGLRSCYDLVAVEINVMGGLVDHILDLEFQNERLNHTLTNEQIKKIYSERKSFWNNRVKRSERAAYCNKAFRILSRDYYYLLESMNFKAFK